MKYLLVFIFLGLFTTSANAGRCLIKIIKENSTTQVCYDVTKKECTKILISVSGNGDASMSFDGAKKCTPSDDWSKLNRIDQYPDPCSKSVDKVTKKE